MEQLLVPIVPDATCALGISRRKVYLLIDMGELQRVKRVSPLAWWGFGSRG